jgi:hypothetical protein
MSSFICFKTSNFNVRAHIFLKTLFNSINVVRISVVKYPCIAIGSNRCKKTWQLWLFIPAILPGSLFAHGPILDTYLSENFTPFSQSHQILFLSRVKVYFVSSIDWAAPFGYKCNSLRISISHKFIRALAVFFVFPSIFINVPKTLSHLFFLICMPFKLCLSFSVDQ